MAKAKTNITGSVKEFASHYGIKDFSGYKNDVEVLAEVDKIYLKQTLELQELKKQLSVTSKSLSEKNSEEWSYLEWKKNDPKGLKSLKMNEPDKYAKIPGCPG